MKLITFILTFLLLTGAVVLAEPPKDDWLTFFYINGDFDYEGPVYKNKKGTIRITGIEDQAQILYEKVLKFAEQTTGGDVVLLYDPSGSGGFLNQRHVRFKIFKGGKKTRANGWGESEIDMTATQNFGAMISEAEKILGAGTVRAKKKLFYYYGEHIPVQPRSPYDLRGIDKKTPSTFSIEQFARGLSAFNRVGGIDLLVMQSCYQNTASFISAIEKTARSVVIPQGGSPKAAAELSSLDLLFDSGTSEIAERFIDSQRSSPHPFNFLQIKTGNSTAVLRAIESSVNVPAYNQALKQWHLRAETEPCEQALEGLVTECVYEVYSGEILIPMADYAGLALRFSGEDSSENRALLEVFFEKHPEQLLLWEPLRQLNSKTRRPR